MGRVRNLKFYGIPDYAASILRRYWGRPIRNAEDYLGRLRGLHGLEIGGPSPMFSDQGGLPIYREVESLDCVNFAASETWHASQEVFAYHPRKAPGKYVVGEAGKLPVAAASYDFVMSSHVIEHCANPIGAVQDWIRTVRPGGYVLIAAPDKNDTFDHRRELTPWSHLLEDYRAGRAEDDPTHLEENVRDIDRTLLPDIYAAVVEQRCRDNLNTRWMHHHTFNTASLVRLVTFCGLELIAVDKDPPMTAIVLGRNPVS